MANERMYPILPCRELDEAIAFYEALGFARTYRQLRPNPYAVVARGDMQVHLFGMPDFDPEQSYGSVMRGRARPGRPLPLVRGRVAARPTASCRWPASPASSARGSGSARSTGSASWTWAGTGCGSPRRARRRRRRTGPRRGWRRSSKSPRGSGTRTATTPQALKTLESGLSRYPEAPALDRARALLFRAELAVRVGNRPLAQSSLAEAQGLPLAGDERAAIAGELAHTAELVAGIAEPHGAAPDAGRG